jgi:hypothetical protein
MFRFTIRDVLWLMVVLALALRWFVTGQRARRLKTENEYLVERIWHVDRDAEREYAAKFRPETLKR